MTEQASTVKKFDKKWIHYAITAIIVFGSQFMPQIGPVTPLGFAVLGSFLGAVYGWTFLDMIWPSIIALLGLGTAVGMTNVLGASFGNPVIPMIILTFAALTILTETKLTDYVVGLFVNNRFAKDRPWVFVFSFLLCGYVCAQINVFVAIILLSGILLDLCKKVDIKPYTPFPTVMLLGLAMSIQMGQVMIPFRSSALTLVGAYSAMTGGMPNFGKYMLFTIPTGIIMILIFTLVCRFIFRVDVSQLKNMPEDLFPQDAKLTRDQKIAVAYLVGIIVVLLSPSFLPSSWGITIFLNKITIFGQAAIVILILMLVRKEDGTPFFNYSYCASKGVSWEGLFMTAFILPIATYLTGEGTGIGQALGMLFAPMAQFSPIIFVIIVMIFAAFITNFANNVVLACIIMPVVVQFSGQVGLPMMGVCILLFVLTQFALFTPGASPIVGMAFSRNDWVKTTMMMKYGLATVLILAPIFLLIGIPYMYVIF